MTPEERLDHRIEVFWAEVPWATLQHKDAHGAATLLSPWILPDWKIRIVVAETGEYALEFYRRSHVEGRHYRDEVIFFCHDWEAVKANQRQFEVHLRQCLKDFAMLPR